MKNVPGVAELIHQVAQAAHRVETAAVARAECENLKCLIDAIVEARSLEQKLLGLIARGQSLLGGDIIADLVAAKLLDPAVDHFHRGAGAFDVNLVSLDLALDLLPVVPLLLAAALGALQDGLFAGFRVPAVAVHLAIQHRHPILTKRTRQLNLAGNNAALAWELEVVQASHRIFHSFFIIEVGDGHAMLDVGGTE